MNDEVLKRAKVGCHTFQQEIDFARQHVAVADDRGAPRALLEGDEIRLGLAMQPDHGKCGDIETERFVVEDGGEALDDPGLLERTHAAQAGGRRDTHLARKLDIGDTPVSEKLAQDQPIGCIKARSTHVGPSSHSTAPNAQPLPDDRSRRAFEGDQTSCCAWSGSHAILRPLGKRIEKKLSVLHSGNSNHGRGACRALEGSSRAESLIAASRKARAEKTRVKGAWGCCRRGFGSIFRPSGSRASTSGSGMRPVPSRASSKAGPTHPSTTSVWSPPPSGVRFTLKRKAKFPITKPCTSAACAGLSVRLPLPNLR